MLLTEKGCRDWKQEIRDNKSTVLDIPSNKLYSFAVMSNQAFEIRGTAYECKMIKMSIRTWETFFGAPVKEHTRLKL